MRISTSLLFETGARAISRQQAEWARTQQQLSTGRRLIAASDDPLAAAQALRAGEAAARAAHYEAAQATARSNLALAEAVLARATETLQGARELLVQANAPTLGDADRASLAQALRARFLELLALANARDADGQYLFSGYRGATQPFAETAAGVVYQGDEGERALAVAEGRLMTVALSGAWLFDRVPQGNGWFRVEAGAANAGTAVHDGGTVTDPAALTGHRYRIQFGAGAPPAYDVVDLDTGTTVVAGAPYASGRAIEFDGVRLVLTGAPAAGDSFDVAPSGAASVFDTLRALADRLAAPAGGAAGRAAVANAIASGLDALDRALDRVLEARARAGAGLAELEALGALVSAEKLQHETEAARLAALDYAEAASRFAAQQTALEAAQRAYVRLTSLSLFDLL
ncbi:MAG: flagellar hook-associated protein FlgL [Burkholderiales bacterium]|nr:flagellar hook-associated protein FlgL [Burkholderiales bacterium]